MAGHSKWANIKHRKAREDAKKGKAFSQVVKEITVAARIGGGDPDMNPRLRAAVDKARAVNMPKDNVDRAIKKGTGEGNDAPYEEVSYEGYGPGGVAVLVDAMTDNRNRTVADVRHAFSKNNGNLGETGCVSWLFEPRGFIVVSKAAMDEEKIMEAAIEAGADDVEDGGDVWEITTDPSAFTDVLDNLKGAEIAVESSELTKIPKTTVAIEGKTVEQMLRLMEMLEENEDVQNVYANFDIDDSEMERMATAG